ncbi:hypothetical protein M431DRAFT_258085 [Trichoderma harzianum CBS 226.95]|uniref:Uncharacterized protein n=1 Tax=Trichoderma harzianum CBS 226.95 TaxID=983964 RepID=A0A2T4A0M0_TRIHA|nr:hypothetical protein M431DRAFT_258085 [Trichoderma harzianum CBS 226.95]PTB50616.1 hypothetical protein M431DRAFT_258085 [Trichoderma harzianum CBS 226.95]
MSYIKSTDIVVPTSHGQRLEWPGNITHKMLNRLRLRSFFSSEVGCGIYCSPPIPSFFVLFFLSYISQARLSLPD